jgi:hypothetical protein
LVFIWFHNGFIFAGGEDGISFYNPSLYLIYVKYIWNQVNAGYPILYNLPRIPFSWLISFLYNLGFSSVFLQAATFFILMSTGSIATFFLIEEILSYKSKNRLTSLTSFIGAVFYLLNPFSMVQIWGRGLYFQFFAFALVPLFFLFFILSNKYKNLIYSILGIFASFIFSSMFVSPTQSLVLWAPILIYLPFYLFENRRDKSNVSFAIFNFLFIVFFWVLTQLWWVIPNATIGNNVYNLILNDTASNVGTLEGASRSYPLTSLIRLIHNGPFYDGKYYGEIYSNVFFILLSWIIPIVSLFSITSFKKYPYFNFYKTLFLISLFVCLGSNLPLGFIFVWFFKNIPLLQAFRNPFEKFGVVFLLAYTPFFAVGTSVLSQKIKNKFKNGKLYVITSLIIIFSISVIFSWPMWLGNFAGGYKFNPWVKVPDYYQAANEWLNENGKEYRLLQLPLIPGDGIRYLWSHAYNGVEPSNLFFDRISISRQAPFGKEFYNILLNRFGGFMPNIAGPDPDITNSELKGKKLSDELIKLGIKHIVLHHDVDTKYSGSKSLEETELYLSNQSNIKKIKVFGELDIYEVEGLNNTSIIYSPDREIKYTTINPSFYKLDIESKKSFKLFFLNLYSDQWELFVNNKKVENHFKVFSYANGWTVDDLGKLNIVIKYKPQEGVTKGWYITFGSLLMLVLVCLIIFLKSYVNKKNRF